MKKDDNTELGIALTFIAFIGIVFFWFVAFLAVVFTVIALIALFHPVKLGSLEVTHDDARRFLIGGVIGAVLGPAVVALLAAVFNLRPNWDMIAGFTIVGGYILGTIAGEMTKPKESESKQLHVVFNAADDEQEDADDALSPRQLEMFEFARWDDEEARR